MVLRAIWGLVGFSCGPLYGLVSIRIQRGYPCSTIVTFTDCLKKRSDKSLFLASIGRQTKWMIGLQIRRISLLTTATYRILHQIVLTFYGRMLLMFILIVVFVCNLT
jgi:hypothetical protein